MIVIWLLTFFPFNTDIGLYFRQYATIIDTTKLIEYFAPVVNNAPDSTLLIGEVKIFGWIDDSTFHSVDSGIYISLFDGENYLSVETKRNGLFSVLLSYSDKSYDYGRWLMYGLWNDSIIITTVGGGHLFTTTSGIAFAVGSSMECFDSVSYTAVSPDSSYKCGYRFSENPLQILRDFCMVYPEHPYIPVIKSLIEDMINKRVADSLMENRQFSRASKLMFNALRAKPESEYLILSFADLYLYENNLKEILNLLQNFPSEYKNNQDIHSQSAKARIKRWCEHRNLKQILEMLGPLFKND
ncbi:MAG: hypothetical protein ACTSQ8_18760 [Candidatus Helarchaeota archaeon]